MTTEVEQWQTEGKPVYQAYGAITELFQCQDKTVLLEGPAGTGKTMGGCHYLNALAEQHPGCRILMCRKTRTSMTESILVTFEQKVMYARPDVLAGPHRMHRMGYDYPNGSRIVIGGMDDPARIMSTEYDIAYLCEAVEFTIDDWEMIRSRLRNNVIPFQQIIADTNPGAPSHWLNKYASEGRITRIRSRHTDNPTITDDYLDTLKSLTGARYQRLYLGKWVGQEGLVFEDWNPDIHIIDEAPQRMSRYFASKDWGWTNPGVSIIFGEDGDGRLYVLHQVYMTQRTIHWWQLKDKQLDNKWRITRSGRGAWVCDPSQPAHIASYRKEQQMRAVEANNDIEYGLTRIQERLTVAGDGKPRLMFVRGNLERIDQSLVEKYEPTCTEEEFDAYVWAEPREDRNMKEEPVDQFNHGIDALRYGVVYAERDAGGFSYRNVGPKRNRRRPVYA